MRTQIDALDDLLQSGASLLDALREARKDAKPLTPPPRDLDCGYRLEHEAEEKALARRNRKP